MFPLSKQQRGRHSAALSKACPVFPIEAAKHAMLFTRTTDRYSSHITITVNTAFYAAKQDMACVLKL